MNPLVRSYLDQLRNAIGDLDDAVQERQRQLTEEREKRERLLQQYWSRGKEISVLGQNQAAYETLRDENTRLKEAHAELSERLGRVLAYTKALTAELRQ